MRPGRSRTGGWGGGGGGLCAVPPVCAAGGPVGLGVALPRSIPLPSLGRQQSRSSVRCSGHCGRGPHTVSVRLLPSGALRVAPLCAAAGSLVDRGSCGSRRLGRAGGPCSGLPPRRRSPAGGRGDHCHCLGGAGGRGSRGVRVGGGDGGIGRDRAVGPLLPLLGGRPAALCSSPLPPPAHPFPVHAFRRGRGAAFRQRASLAGGGGLCYLLPSLCPPWAGNIAGDTGDARAMGARPPYCSGLLWCAAPGCGPCAGFVRWCVFACLPRPPRGQVVGGVGACGVQVRLCPPPGRHGPFSGREDAPSAAGGVEGRRPRGPQSGG